MGRILDLFSEVAAEAEEGSEGLVLSPDTAERLRADWGDEDIEDMLGLVHETLVQGELIEAADSLSARLVEVLGVFGEHEAFERVRAGEARLSFELIGHLARRVDRLEEVLQGFREGGTPVDRGGFDALQRRLANLGIEAEMKEGAPPGQDDDE